MKKAVLISTMGALATLAGVVHAEEFGRVTSAQPVVQQVAVPRQVCSVQQVQAQPSGGGAVLGALVGGLLGNQVGHGMGRAAATGAGVIAGAAVGNNIQNGDGRYQSAQTCNTQTAYENRTTAYNVTYEYGGKQYTVQLPYDPGPTIRLNVTPVGSNTIQDDPAYAPQSYAPQGYVQQTYAPQTEVVSTVGYPVYSAPYYAPGYAPAYPYYSPVGVSIGLGYYGGGGHRHWR